MRCPGRFPREMPAPAPDFSRSRSVPDGGGTVRAVSTPPAWASLDLETMAELVVTSEGVRTQHVSLQKDRTTLGRRLTNDIALADLSVSGVHCVFERLGPTEVWLKDLGSTNGTFINGEKIQQHRLVDQDLISIGTYRVRFLSEPLPDEVGQTAPMRLEELGAPGSAGALQARVQVLSGDAAGREVMLVKTVTTFGRPGDAVVAVYHRRFGYYVALVDAGGQPALHNGSAIGPEARLLADQDVLELADSKLLFILGS